jgi:hypothetical protein
MLGLPFSGGELSGTAFLRSPILNMHRCGNLSAQLRFNLKKGF